MEFLVTRVEYAIPIQPEDLIALDRYERPSRPGWSGEKTLGDLLDEIPGVDRTEYNGHFGAFVYVRIEQEYDTDATRDKIRITIRQAVRKATETV